MRSEQARNNKQGIIMSCLEYFIQSHMDRNRSIHNTIVIFAESKFKQKKINKSTNVAFFKKNLSVYNILKLVLWALFLHGCVLHLSC